MSNVTVCNRPKGVEQRCPTAVINVDGELYCPSCRTTVDPKSTAQRPHYEA